MSNPTGHDKQPIGNDKPDGNHKPDDLAALDSDAETGSAHDPKKVASEARASASHGPNRAAAAGMPAESFRLPRRTNCSGSICTRPR